MVSSAAAPSHSCYSLAIGVGAHKILKEHKLREIVGELALVGGCISWPKRVIKAESRVIESDDESGEKKKKSTKNNVIDTDQNKCTVVWIVRIQWFLLRASFTAAVARIIRWWRFAHGDVDRGVITPRSLVNIIRCGDGEREMKKHAHSEGCNSTSYKIYVMFYISKCADD